jgi:hypothetical protein
MSSFHINRRQFLQSAAAATALAALPSLGADALDLVHGKPKRVGLIYGEKGTLKASTMRADFIPLDKNAKPMHFECLFEREQYPEDVAEKDIELNAAPATRKHMLDFLAAIEKRSRPIADIEQGHISTASCVLANVAMDLGRPVIYDPKKRIVLGDREATQKLRRPYRSPWKRPASA